MSTDGAVTDPSIARAEHDDTAQAKRVLNYGWTGTQVQKFPISFIDLAFDYIGFTNADANGNYQTWTFKTGGSGGTTVRTLSVTYDSNSKITSITRT